MVTFISFDTNKLPTVIWFQIILTHANNVHVISILYEMVGTKPNSFVREGKGAVMP